MKVSNVSAYLKAVVYVEAEGFFVERLINLCKINNVKVWDINYINSGRITFIISAKDFKKLKPLVKKSKCKIKIKKKEGIYFNMFKYRKRRLVLYLILAFIFFVFVTSSFIWNINITLDPNIDGKKVEKLLNDIDIHKGKNKLFISKGKIVDYLRANMYEAAWVGVDINGTALNISIKEKIISKEEDKNALGDIVATKSCVISKIIAENGTARFKTGSYIEEGMVAIEGVLDSKLIEPIRVHASGILKGIVEYSFEKKYLYNEQIKEYQGKSNYGVGFGINNKEFLLKCLPKENKYDINSKVKTFNIFSVNISFIFNTYEKYILKDIVNTKETLTLKGEQDSTLYFDKELTKDSRIVDKNVEIVENSDGITYKVVLNVEENIGKFVQTGDI